jgi:hypothetical protein
MNGLVLAKVIKSKKVGATGDGKRESHKGGLGGKRTEMRHKNGAS